MNANQFRERLGALPFQVALEWRGKFTCGGGEGIFIGQFPNPIGKFVFALVKLHGVAVRVEAKTLAEELDEEDFFKACKLLCERHVLSADSLLPLWRIRAERLLASADELLAQTMAVFGKKLILFRENRNLARPGTPSLIREQLARAGAQLEDARLAIDRVLERQMRAHTAFRKKVFSEACEDAESAFSALKEISLPHIPEVQPLPQQPEAVSA